jgi:ketosteroid isomerase-like protein
MTTNDDPDVTLILRAYASYARGDIDAAVADLHEDVEWIEPDEFPNGGAHHGREAVAAYLRASHAQWASLTSQPTATRQGNDIVVVHHVHGVLLDGSAQEATVADVYTVVNGAVMRMQAYADPADAVRPRRDAP